MAITGVNQYTTYEITTLRQNQRTVLKILKMQQNSRRQKKRTAIRVSIVII